MDKSGNIGELLNRNTSLLRVKIAREAAHRIYSGMEKEYKQAKLKASKAMGSNFLPTNLEVAIELDRIADEQEGPTRLERLVQMRKEALKLMYILRIYRPLLVGSVWRGTVHRDSDIDIVVHHDEPEDVLKALTETGVRIQATEFVAVTKKGNKEEAFHIYAESTVGEKAEIKVCSREVYRRERCAIYGDEVVGLHIAELESMLESTPTQRFVPF